MAKVEVGRGMSPAKEKFWKEVSTKEELMRLRWFTKNQKRLKALAEQERAKKGLSPEVLAEVERLRLDRYRNMERFNRKRTSEIQLPEIDPNCIMNVMKPVNNDVKRLLYENMERQGRIQYLTKRYHDSPEHRYYFPECSSFVYGWKIRLLQKQMADDPRYGRRQVIKHSFYRRNGGLKADPPENRQAQGCTKQFAD